MHEVYHLSSSNRCFCVNFIININTGEVFVIKVSVIQYKYMSTYQLMQNINNIGEREGWCGSHYGFYGVGATEGNNYTVSSNVYRVEKKQH